MVLPVTEMKSPADAGLERDAPSRRGHREPGRDAARALSEDLGGGLVLLAVAGVLGYESLGLGSGELGRMGPGLMPQALSVLLGVCGVALTLRALRAKAPRAVTVGGVRGPLFVLGAAGLFALTIRPLGLVVAAPLAVLVSALGAHERRLGEGALLALGLTVFTVVLFKLLLGLPIPLAPWLLGY